MSTVQTRLADTGNMELFGLVSALRHACLALEHLTVADMCLQAEMDAGAERQLAHALTSLKLAGQALTTPPAPNRAARKSRR